MRGATLKKEGRKESRKIRLDLLLSSSDRIKENREETFFFFNAIKVDISISIIIGIGIGIEFGVIFSSDVQF